MDLLLARNLLNGNVKIETCVCRNKQIINNINNLAVLNIQMNINEERYKYGVFTV